MGLLLHPLHLRHCALHIIFPYRQTDRDAGVSQHSQDLRDTFLLLLLLLTTTKWEKGLYSLFAYRIERKYPHHYYFQTLFFCTQITDKIVMIMSQKQDCEPTDWPPDVPLFQRVDALTERKEDPVDVSFLQVEAAGHRAVADALGEQSEGQQDSVGQRQASPSGHSGPGFGALKHVCDVLMGGGLCYSSQHQSDSRFNPCVVLRVPVTRRTTQGLCTSLYFVENCSLNPVSCKVSK
ncbi:hypothetical protein PFLUV_G00180470 [Perca fluviatilis]|uniref:Uncharacterized protein n=1 Tax=Perca fluviatilis TaxID=8168 RepID=A0A6A5EN97_PERFL|nr:hypothetical protein PFLUV_G00180470 [Perca fluviatilis]